MGESNWVYTVMHYDKSNAFASQDVTGDVVDIKFDDVVNELHAGLIILDADRGHYMRDQRAGESGYPTKIEKQDRIRIISADGSGVTTNYNEVFDVIKKIPIKSEGGGTYLRLMLKHVGRWLEDGIPFIGRGTFENPSQMWQNVGDYYNANKGSDQPTLSGHLTTDATNKLPQGIIEHFDFGNNEEKPFERLRQIADQMGASGANGGVLDFFDFKVKSAVGDVTSFTLDVFSSGSPSDGSEVTIDTSLDATVNAGETDGGEEELRGNVVFIWGSNDGGTLLTGYARFKGRQILFPDPENALFAEHVAGTYEADSIVKLAGTVYQNSSKTSNVPPAAPWVVLTTAAYYGNVIQYSEFTDDKVALWENSGGDPEDQFDGNYGQTMPDINIILNDDTTFGTWVDVASTTDAFNVFWKYGAASGGVYEGLRVLVNGTGTAGFSGNDSEGRAFTNSIAEFVDGEWRVKYPAEDDMFCIVFDEGRFYKFDLGTTTWVNVTTLDNASHSLHPYTSLANGESIHKDENDTEYTTTNASSSIVATYEWEPLASWAQSFFNDRVNSNYYEAGAWLVLRFPFPKSTYNSITEDVGQIYGGGGRDWVTATAYVVGDVVNESQTYYFCHIAHTSGTFATDLTAGKWKQITGKQPSHIDAQNMTFTHNGARGFNFGISSNDYGPISAIDFFMKILYTDRPVVGDPTVLPKGNFKMRCWMIDQSDHVVYQDYVISHNDNWQSVSLPLSGFQIYRGRRPRFDISVFPLADLVPPRGLSAQEQFEWRHIAMIGWQTQESYDDFGRYQGGRGDFGIFNIFSTSNRRMKMFIDGLRFKKPLLVNTGLVTDSPKVLMPFPEEKGVIVYDQLEAIAHAENEKAQFEKVEYEIETSIRHDVNAGDFLFLLDAEIVDKQDDSTDNKIKVVCKSAEYYIKGDGESGGATRLLKVGRRFV